ncbi:BTAD domain-containing putative transcriptional regulator [Actinoplanes sp. NPDC026623]|uniref:BTAD domain-containing putative transcriptional regulator n=1 Tax=Actinoplanes sp. NPDC026623 TaxID=3155610 RepID=UPI0033E50239
MAAEHEGLDLRLLGTVCAWRDGAEVALGSARCTAVLSVLALHAGHTVSREQLIAAVWGEDPPASANGNVYTYVSALRRILEPGRDRWSAGRMLTSGAGGYRLHVPDEAVDVHRFESLRELSRRHRARGDTPAELAALEAAMALWRGDALTGVPGRHAEAQRLRLAELRLATAERRAALLVELGRHDEAITTLRALVAAYPLQENLHAMLMAALHAGGRRAEALEVHDRLRDLLRDETGTEPSAALRAVHSRVLGESPAAVFVGRAAEARLLRDAVAEAAAGRGGSVWLKGTPGMGKSALLAAALREAAPPGCRIGWAAGDELSRRVPLGVLLECVESAVAGDEGRELGRRLLAAATAPGTVDLAVAVIRRAAVGGPLILVIDDLELADDATLRVWTALHALTGELPLLLVSAGGPAADDRRLDPLRAVHPGEVVLSRLTPAEAAALVWRTAPEPPEPRVLRRLLADAGGNPYYLRQLSATAGREPGDPLPADVVAAVAAHLGPFAEETRQILRAVAFLGADAGGHVECTVPEVAAVTGRPADEIRRVLAPAHAAGVLGAGPLLVFRHRIVARILHEGTPTALRVMLHRSFAEKVAAAGGAPERVVAQLLAGPVPLDPWAGRWLADHVEQLWVCAPRPTIAVLQRARAQSNLDHDTRLRLTAWLARLLYGQDRGAVAEALWVAARSADPALEAEMRWIVAATHDRRGDHAAAAEVARLMLSDRRAPEPWLERFRELLTRLRPDPPGEPRLPRMRRTAGRADPISVIG